MDVFMQRVPILAAACMAATALCGCSRSFTAREYPSFYDPNLRTVAIVPFENETNTPGAGMQAAENLAAALRINGTYVVVPPRKLQSLMAQKKLRGLSRTDYQEDARQLRELGTVQAFVVGTVLRDSALAGLHLTPYGYGPYYPTTYSSDGRVRYELLDEDEGGEEGGEEGKEEFDNGFGDDFGDDFNGGFYGPYYPYWYWNYPYYYPEYTAQAHVSLRASMVRVSDGAVLYNTSVPVQGRADLSGYRWIPPGSAALDAMNRATVKLVKDLAVVPVKVKVNPRADLKTAAGQENGRWMFSNNFSSSDPSLYVVVQLPAAVAHDTFRLTIVPKGKPDETVAAKDFTWPPGQTTDAIAFSPREIVAHAGAGAYTVTFYSMGEAVMHDNFTIR